MTNFMKKIILLVVVTLLTCITATVYADSLNNNNMTSLSGMLQTVMPTVVNVSAQGEIKGVDNPLADPNQAPQQPRRFEALGSGVIVDASKGYILTNAHVLRDVQTITITLNDGRVFKAKLVGSDPASDVAVLQIQANKLTAAQLGDSDKLKVGDFVAAIGNPLSAILLA
jgi:serine protease Do